MISSKSTRAAEVRSTLYRSSAPWRPFTKKRAACAGFKLVLSSPARWPASITVANGKPPVPVVNQIRTYWWCSPPRIWRQRICPASSTAREIGASFSKDKCVRISCDNSCTTAGRNGGVARRTQQRGQGIPCGSNRSAFQHIHFAKGARGDVGRSRMPIDRSLRIKTSP